MKVHIGTGTLRVVHGLTATVPAVADQNQSHLLPLGTSSYFRGTNCSVDSQYGLELLSA